MRFITEYTRKLKCIVANWKIPNRGHHKCNSDRDSKVNPGLISIEFYIRDGKGDLVYAEGRRIEDSTNLVVRPKGWD